MERFVRRRISDPHQADDVVAEVMLRIHQTSRFGRRPRTGHGVGVPHHPQRDHRSLPSQRSPPRSARRRIDPVADPSADAWLDDQDATLAELAACIRPLVGALPSDFRRAIELTDFEGHTQADAARMEGISVSGMKSRVQRGRRQFATLVKQCCDVTTDSRGELVDFNLRADGCGCPPPAVNSPRRLSHPLPVADSSIIVDDR